MKKHILFLSGGLKIGGVERVLVEYLNNIDKEKYKITLFLMSDFGKEAIFHFDICITGLLYRKISLIIRVFPGNSD